MRQRLHGVRSEWLSALVTLTTECVIIDTDCQLRLVLRLQSCLLHPLLSINTDEITHITPLNPDTSKNFS